MIMKIYQIVRNNRLYRSIVFIQILLYISLLLYVIFLWKYMNDYVLVIFGVYVPVVAIVIFSVYIFFNQKRTFSLIFTLINILIIYKTITYINSSLQHYDVEQHEWKKN